MSDGASPGPRTTSDPLTLTSRVAFIAGGVLVLTAVLFPVPVDSHDYSEFLDLMVENSARTRAVLLTVPAGIWAFAVAVMHLPRVQMNGWSSVWVQIGAYLVLIGAGAVTVQFGMGSAALAEASADNLESGLALWAGSTHIRAFSMLVVWLGLAGVGIGLLKGGRVAGWVGIVPVVLGLVVAWASVSVIVAGQTRTTATVSGGAAVLTALWAVLVGIGLRSIAPNQSEP